MICKIEKFFWGTEKIPKKRGDIACGGENV